MAIHRLSASSPYVQVILRAGGRHVECIALIDTGASITAVHPDVIKELEPQVIGVADFVQVGGSQQWVPTYFLAIFLDGHPDPVGVEVVAANPSSTCQVLIGRDLLSRWIISYDGPYDRMIISY
jgi:predicted aspartyl protease